MELADGSLPQKGKICFPTQGCGALKAHWLADPFWECQFILRCRKEGFTESYNYKLLVKH